MPASQRSLRLTNIYQDRIVTLTDRIGRLVTHQWGAVDLADLEGTHRAWLAAAVAQVEHGQRVGVALTTGYLTAFIASEQGVPPAGQATAAESRFVGFAEDGDPVGVPLAKTLIASRVAMKDGKPPANALAEQGRRAGRLVSSATAHAPRQALAEQIATHPEIIGWNRVTHGGCGACLAAAAHTHGKDKPLHVHPHCECTQEPVIRGVPNTHPRPTGPEIFAAMDRAQQDQALGPEAAQLVRQGRVSWPDLIAYSPMEAQADYLTQAVITAVEG